MQINRGVLTFKMNLNLQTVHVLGIPKNKKGIKILKLKNQMKFQNLDMDKTFLWDSNRSELKSTYNDLSNNLLKISILIPKGFHYIPLCCPMMEYHLTGLQHNLLMYCLPLHHQSFFSLHFLHHHHH